jgi:Flagellar assembly protein T, middle domain
MWREFVMPIRSRLLRLVFIVAGTSFALSTWAMGDFTPVKPKPAQNVDAEVVASADKPLPFDNQSVPSATVQEPAAKPAAEVVDSKAETRKLGNNQCSGGENNALQKSLLVTAFPRTSPTSSSAGALSDVEHQLPQLLSQQLESKHSAITPVQINEGLPSPALSNDNLLAQQIQKLARNQRTQLVLTGEIVDMAMAHPEATYSPGLYTRFVNGLFDFIEVKNRFDKRERVFSFQVNLRDGFTGQSLFSKRYNTYGIWGSTQDVGFGTPLFWKSDYGQQVKGLVKMASKEVGAVIQCQPYIAQIDSRPGQTQILLQGGANNGLHAGDTLALYQMVVQGSETEYAQHQVRLVNRNAAIELREVYPSHSVGVVSGTTFLTGQFLAVVP